ncbi:MAG: MFS transporter [Planctomycetota bacterium]|nr:MFS transporter [Planctomycetota bacterium]MDA1140567.1 MFS transporter [Planctomycetota bacterium]
MTSFTSRVRELLSPWGFLAAFCLGHFFIDYYAGLNTPLYKSFQESFGLTTSQFFTYTLPATVFGSLMQPFLGVAGDRFNRGILVGFALLLAATFHSLSGTATHPLILSIYMTLGGLGVGLFHPCAAAAVSNLIPERKNLVMSVFLVAGMTGLGLSAPFVAWFVQVDQVIVLPRTWLLAPMGLMAAMILLAVTPFAASSRPNTEVDRPATIFSTVRDLFSHEFSEVRQLWYIAFIRSFVMIVFQSLVSYVAAENKWDVVMGGACFGSMTVAFGIGGLLGGYLSDRGSLRRIFLVSTLGPAPFLLLAANTQSEAIMLTCYGGAGLFVGLANPLTVVFAQNLKPDRPGLVSGLMLGFAWGVSGILMPLVGKLKDEFGLSPTLSVVSLLLIPAGILVAKLPMEKGQSRPVGKDSGII